MSKANAKPDNVNKRSRRAETVPKGDRAKETRRERDSRDSPLSFLKDFNAMTAAANHYNIDVLELVLLSGATLKGIIGRSAVLKVGSGVEPVPSANVLFPDDARPQKRALEALTSVISLMQARLVQNQSLISGRMSLNAQESTRGRARRDGRSDSFIAAPGQPSLAAILSKDPVAEVAYHESIRHPRIMITGVSMELLSEEIESCHQCHSLLISPGIDDAQPGRKSLDKLAMALSGNLVPCQRDPNKVKRPVDRLHGQIIGPVKMEWLREVAELGHPVLEDFILLEPNTGNNHAADFTHLDEFKRIFRGVLVKLLDMRLQLQVHQVILRDQDACEAFIGMEAAYQTACDRLQHEPGNGVRGIPMLLLWTMGLYLTHFNTGQTELDLVKWVYSAASTLVNRHLSAFLKVRKMAAVESRLKIADRMIEILDGEAPMKAWALRRHFNDQGKGEHDPIIRAMRELDCLAVKDQKIELGTVPYEQARPLLVEKILKGMSADTFPDVSILPDKDPGSKIRETGTANTAKKRRRAA